MALLLLKKGAEIHTKDGCGETALYIAAGTCYNDIITLLIRKGADVNAINKDGNTPLIHAVVGLTLSPEICLSRFG